MGEGILSISCWGQILGRVASGGGRDSGYKQLASPPPSATQNSVTGSALERDIKQNTGPSGQIEQVPKSLTEVLSSPISSPRTPRLLGIQQVSVIP